MNYNSGASLGDIIGAAIDKKKKKEQTVDLRPKPDKTSPNFVTDSKLFLVSEGEHWLSADDINFYAVLSKGDLIFAIKHFRNNYSLSLTSSINIVKHCRESVYR